MWLGWLEPGIASSRAERDYMGSRQGAVRRVATMQTTKRSGMSKATASTSGTYVATGPRRTTDRITAKQMRDFDARVDRAMEQAKQVSADLKRIGRK